MPRSNSPQSPVARLRRAASWLPPIVLVVAVLLAGGCNNANLDQMVDQGMQKVSQGVEGVKEKAQEVGGQVQQQVQDQVKQGLQQARDQVNQQTGQAGTMHLELDSPVDVEVCHAALVSFNDGRPAVLQLQSYRDADSETFPSVFLRAVSPSVAPAELVGKTVEAELFVQLEQSGPVWFTADPVQLQITSADGEKIVADLVGGALQRTDGQQPQAVKGRLEGRFSP